MSERGIAVPSIEDRELIRFFVAAAETVGADHFSMRIIGSPTSVTFPVSGDDANGWRPILLKSTLRSISHGSIGQSSFGLTFTRDSSAPGAPAFDKLQIGNSHQPHQPAGPDVSQIHAVNKLVDKHFKTSASQSFGLFASPQAFEALVLSHQELLQRLEGTATRVTEDMVAARTRLEGEFSARTAEIEASLAERRKILENETATAREQLAEREAAIESRKTALDDRDHIHARRELREKITSGIAEKLKGAIIPADTSAIGYLVLFFTIVGAAFLGILSFESFRDVSTILTTNPVGANASIPSATWFLLARAFLTGFGSIGFLIYAIAWLKALYHDRLRAHRELERYSIDLNRASWAVETMMEAKSSGAAIPDILVAGLAKNLFDYNPTAPSGEDGENALSSLLRASAKAKFGPSGAEFEMNGRGANKLADKIEKP